MSSSPLGSAKSSSVFTCCDPEDLPDYVYATFDGFIFCVCACDCLPLNGVEFGLGDRNIEMLQPEDCLWRVRWNLQLEDPCNANLLCFLTCCLIDGERWWNIRGLVSMSQSVSGVYTWDKSWQEDWDCIDDPSEGHTLDFESKADVFTMCDHDLVTPMVIRW